MFRQDTQKEIEIDALEFGYNQMYLEEINKLKEENRSKEEALVAKDEALAAKDEKIRLERIYGIKEIMSSFGVNFDKAFDTLKIDPSLKEEYRRLVEEKTKTCPDKGYLNVL